VVVIEVINRCRGRGVMIVMAMVVVLIKRIKGKKVEGAERGGEVGEDLIKAIIMALAGC